MSSLPTLLKNLESLHRQHIEIEHQITSARRQIIALGKSPPKSRRRRSMPPRELIELIRPLLKVLRDAGGPLPRREIAARLSLTPKAASYRLEKALKAGFIERVSGARYRAARVVPAL